LRDFFTFSKSGPAPTAASRDRAAEVFARVENAAESTTRGTSGTVLTLWPRARRRAALEEAAIAEAVAKRLNSG